MTWLTELPIAGQLGVAMLLRVAAAGPLIGVPQPSDAVLVALGVQVVSGTPPFVPTVLVAATASGGYLSHRLARRQHHAPAQRSDKPLVVRTLIPCLAGGAGVPAATVLPGRAPAALAWVSVMVGGCAGLNTVVAAGLAALGPLPGPRTLLLVAVPIYLLRYRQQGEQAVLTGLSMRPQFDGATR